MSIAITCDCHPEKGMTTKLYAGPDGWEVEVTQHFGSMSMRLASLDGTVDLAGALDVLWDAGNGEADELARALGLPEDVIAAAWTRHSSRLKGLTT